MVGFRASAPPESFLRNAVPEGPRSWRLGAHLLRTLVWLLLASTAWLAFVLALPADLGSDGWLVAWAQGAYGLLVPYIALEMALAWWALHAWRLWVRRDAKGLHLTLWLAAVLVLWRLTSAWGMPIQADEAWTFWGWRALWIVHGAVGVALLALCFAQQTRLTFRQRPSDAAPAPA